MTTQTMPKKYPKPFKAEQFTALRTGSTQQDKANFANHFVRFVLSGFNRNLFFSWFYRRLSMTFSHIAHYNAACFYETWFSTPAKRWDFVTHTMACPIYGDADFTYSDVERALQVWLHENRMLVLEATR